MLIARSFCRRFVPLASAVALALLHAPSVSAQVVGKSVNMVTGTTLPTGDPFLERQNEPSMAVSSRNPLHLIAGNNDYRTVDLPGLPYDEPTGDAWLGFFTSVDGGNSWQSTLVPGYPQDASDNGVASPLSVRHPGGFDAAADATVRAGTNGLFYYSGLAFNREGKTIQGGSAIFLARYVDDNNFQGANTVRYIDTHVVKSYTDAATPAYFADKPFMAVDISRGSSTCTIPGSSTVPVATIPAGKIYVAYTLFNGGEESKLSSIMLTSSIDCGATWSAPQKVSGNAQTNQGATLAIEPHTGDLYIFWRIFKDQTYPDEIAGAALQYGTNKVVPILQMPISAFDQGTNSVDQGTPSVSFRTNAYPSIAVNNSQHLYVAWSQRGSTTNTAGGDARVQVLVMTGIPSFTGTSSTSSGMTSSPIITVDPYAGRGHQIMPALAFSSGRLTVAWYDFRNDDQVNVYTVGSGGAYKSMEELPLVAGVPVVPRFSNQVVDPPRVWRQTVDIRAAQASPSPSGQFSPSVVVSQYAFGTPLDANGGPITPSYLLPNDPDNIQQLDFNPPNLPLFAGGTAPFVGDYIDVAGPTFVYDPSSQKWRFNNLPSDPDHTHVVWTDNRNVIPPSDGNWANFTPPVGPSTGDPVFNPDFQQCSSGNTSDRNQDIFTAALSPGIIMSSRGNFKQLSTSLVRGFPVTVDNPTNQTVYFSLTIQSQPTGGSASFQQPSAGGKSKALTQLTVGVPPLSSASRSVFVTSSNPTATIIVNATQSSASGQTVSGGLTTSVTLNGDSSNPPISNPNITTAEIYNPEIANPEIANPEIANPEIANPEIANPEIANPEIANPEIANPEIANPEIANPEIANPEIANPEIANTALLGSTDESYSVTNTGNTSASYTVNLVGSLPTGVKLQLVVSGVYLTNIAKQCALAQEAHYIPIVNITTPTLQIPGFVPPAGPPAALAPSFSLEPGQQAIVTIRFYYPKTSPQLLQQALAAIAPVISSQGLNQGALPLLITTPSPLPNGSPSAEATYSATIQATGGTLPYRWTVTGLPSNLTATPNPDVPGTLDLNGGAFSDPGTTQVFTINVQVTDASGRTVQKTFTLTVNAG